jgi:hypothetical protein
MAATSGRFPATTGVCAFALSVMSASGVECREVGVGVGVALGEAGNGAGFGVSSCVISDGSFSVFSFSVSGSVECLGVGSAIEGASDTVEAIDALVFLFALTLGRPARLRGDAFLVGEGGGSDAGGVKSCDASTDSLIRVRRLVDLGGAGVNSSSSLMILLTSSSSDSSTIFLLEAVARRDGRDGDAADIVLCVDGGEREVVEMFVAPSQVQSSRVNKRSSERAERSPRFRLRHPLNSTANSSVIHSAPLLVFLYSHQNRIMCIRILRGFAICRIFVLSIPVFNLSHGVSTIHAFSKSNKCLRFRKTLCTLVEVHMLNVFSGSP